MSGNDETFHLVAVAAAALAVVAVVLLVVLSVRVHRMRRAQTAVLGEHGADDLVAHAARLSRTVTLETAEWRSTAARLQERMGGIEGALLNVFSRHGLIRYDAYGEQSGQQSCSLALLDVRGDGFVMTSIHHRDQARLYIRRINRGKPEHRLAPEEEEALAFALRSGAVASDGVIDGVRPEPRGDVDDA
ncbi:DUF4446 family protein [Patulibacter minatonensis]|uniref:DUF4446 family protein n=1 Tax=Patulibacter minatonensis TaxID=298163 RepID=UPI00047B8D44|nr:DUF4446 family protein [Patulibacter minatonensis]